MVLLILLAIALAGGGTGVVAWLINTPSTEERESMAAEMQAAAPDLVVGHHYQRGGLIDDTSLSVFVRDNVTDEQVRLLSCDVLVPILRAHGDIDLYVDLWVDDLNGEWKGEVRELCAT